MNQNITDKKAVVLVRSKPEEHDNQPLLQFIQQHQIQVMGEGEERILGQC